LGIKTSFVKLLLRLCIVIRHEKPLVGIKISTQSIGHHPYYLSRLSIQRPLHNKFTILDWWDLTLLSSMQFSKMFFKSLQHASHQVAMFGSLLPWVQQFHYPQYHDYKRKRCFKWIFKYSPRHMSRTILKNSLKTPLFLLVNSSE